MIEDRDERATGNPDTIYDLSSVLFHALEGGTSYDRFIRDAEEANDRVLAEFFRQVRDEDGDRANEARRLLADRTRTAARASGAAEESPSEAVERETVTISPTLGEDSTPLGEVPDVRRTGKAPAAEDGTESEEDKGLVDKARDYLRGEGRESDYLRDRER